MRKPQTLLRDLKRTMDKLAKLRDELRDIEAEASEMGDIAADAQESLEYAVERMSEQV
jgi:predicted  nucleic acid-binding Zn-ribbon protein